MVALDQPANAETARQQEISPIVDKNIPVVRSNSCAANTNQFLAVFKSTQRFPYSVQARP